MSDFKPGDVVQLKSGGPLMTAGVVRETSFVQCTWFDREDRLQTHPINAALLMLAPVSEQSEDDIRCL